MARSGLAALLTAAAIAVQAVNSLKAPAVLPGAYIIEYEDNHVSNIHLD
jgi:hypothetical protein